MISLKQKWIVDSVLYAYFIYSCTVLHGGEAQAPVGAPQASGAQAPADTTQLQLIEFRRKYANVTSIQRTETGAPECSLTASITAGCRGPMLMEDFNFMNRQAHINRERIPERIVHAKGYGAHGILKITGNVTMYTSADFLSQIGQEIEVLCRFSAGTGESGSPDTVRDPRGFAVKHYTRDGCFDLVGFNSPMFIGKDPVSFTAVVHSAKKNPQTRVSDVNAFWDSNTLRPSFMHFMMHLYSDTGIPDGFRYMNGHALNTYKCYNAKGEIYWCRFHWISDQGIRNLLPKQAAKIRGVDVDYSIRDLYNAIHRGEYPTWTFTMQFMSLKQAETFPYDPFDSTKIWYDWDIPQIKVGELILNKNVKNFFAEIEQAAFCPANLVPGIAPSPDRVLQGRLFAYSDAQRYRLGANHLQLPINCPRFMRGGFHNQERDGFMDFYSQENMPNFFPNSFYETQLTPRACVPPYKINAKVDRYDNEYDYDFSQAGIYWDKFLNASERTRLVENLAGEIRHTHDFIQERAKKLFYKVKHEFGARFEAALKAPPPTTV